MTGIECQRLKVQSTKTLECNKETDELNSKIQSHEEFPEETKKPPEESDEESSDGKQGREEESNEESSEGKQKTDSVLICNTLDQRC